MPKIKKLPSGNYNALVFSHIENGKRKYKSFTAHTKREVELKVAEYKNNRQGYYKSNIRLSEAIQGYIQAKTAVLSPSTIRGYIGMQKRYFDRMGHERLENLTNEKIQRFISDLSVKVSPKTVRNVYGFLMSVINFYMPSISFRITLPPLHRTITTAPSDEDIQSLFREAQPQLQLCIALAAFGSLRRGEICGLKYKDIKDNTVFVHSDMVKDVNSQWILKDMPKTSDSIRVVTLPDAIIKMLGTGNPDDFIITWTPDSITKRFIDLRKKLNIDIRFHDLRHYFASIGAVLQIPQSFLKDFGGWGENSKIMSSIYQNKIVSMSEHYSKIMTDHFKNLIDAR